MLPSSRLKDNLYHPIVQRSPKRGKTGSPFEKHVLIIRASISVHQLILICLSFRPFPTIDSYLVQSFPISIAHLSDNSGQTYATGLMFIVCTLSLFE